jgi:hypothetical protein
MRAGNVGAHTVVCKTIQQIEDAPLSRLRLKSRTLVGVTAPWHQATAPGETRHSIEICADELKYRRKRIFTDIGRYVGDSMNSRRCALWKRDRNMARE